MGRPPIGKTAMSDAERHKRYMERLRARAAAGTNSCTRETPPQAVRLNWEIDADNDGEGYVWAYIEPNGLYIRQLGDELFFWHVNKDGDDGKDAIDIAEGEAPSLVAAMAAAEAAAAKSKGISANT